MPAPMTVGTSRSILNQKPTFDARDYGEVLQWFDFDDPAQRTLISGRFSQIGDKSGNGNTGDQATAGNRPLLVEGGPLGRSYADFRTSRADNFLLTSLTSTGKNFTLVAAINLRNLGQAARGYLMDASAGRSIAVTEWTTTDTVAWAHATGTTEGFASETGNQVLIWQLHDSPGEQVRMQRIGGTAAAQDFTNTTVNALGGTVRLGTSNDGINFGVDMDLYEWIIYDETLSNAVVTELGRALRQKWSI